MMNIFYYSGNFLVVGNGWSFTIENKNTNDSLTLLTELNLTAKQEKK